MSDRATSSAQLRLLGVDAARGVALLGIMAVHIVPSVGADGDVPAAQFIAGDRATALFPILAGVGLALATGGQNSISGQALARFSVGLTMRALLIFTVGLLLGVLDSGAAVILAHFGVLFVLAIPVLWLRLSPVVLLCAGAGWAVVAPVLSYALRLHMPEFTGANPTAESFQEPLNLLLELMVTGYYPLFPWLAYLLAGVGVGRLALRTPKIAARLLASGVVLAAVTWVTSWVILHPADGVEELTDAGLGGHPSTMPLGDTILTTSFFGTTPTTSWWWLTVAAPFTNTPLAILHTIGTSFAVLGLLLLVAPRLRRTLWPLSAIGSMTLTLYSLHIVLLATVLPREQDYAYLLHVAIMVAIAMPWRAFIGRGPLEALAAYLARSAQGPLT